MVKSYKKITKISKLGVDSVKTLTFASLLVANARLLFGFSFTQGTLFIRALCVFCLAKPKKFT